MSDNFVTVAKIGEISEGESKSYYVNGECVGLFLSQGNYRAINDFCPHAGANLSGGHVEDDTVMCPWHAWRFSLKDGHWCDAPTSPVKCVVYEVRIVNDEIQVCVPVKKTS